MDNKRYIVMLGKDDGSVGLECHTHLFDNYDKAREYYTEHGSDYEWGQIGHIADTKIDILHEWYL